MRSQLKKIFVELYNNRINNSLLNASDVDFLESLSAEDRDSFLERIYQAQQLGIIEAFNEKEKVTLPFIGTFKIKATREKSVQIRMEELAKRGKVSSQELTEDERDNLNRIVKDKVSENVKERKSVKSALMSGRFKLGRKKVK